MQMLENLFLSRWGGPLVMFLILGAVALLLRGLFGPRGLFRDPRWDESNRRIRAEEEAARNARQQAWREKNGIPGTAENPASPPDVDAGRDRKGSDHESE